MSVSAKQYRTLLFTNVLNYEAPRKNGELTKT